MGKKSLLAPTSGKASGSGKDAEKEPNTQTVAGAAKKSAPKSSKGKASPGVSAKKKPGGSKAKKAVAKKASPEKAAKKSAPAKTVEKVATKKAAKKSAPGKAVKKAAPKKEAKKTAPKAAKKAVAKKKAPPRSTAKPKAKKSPVSIKTLLEKRFDMPVSGKMYTPPVRQKPEIVSPPFYTGASPEETQRVRQLLFKKFNRSSPEIERKARPSGLSLEEELQSGQPDGGDLTPDLSSPPAVGDGHEPMDSSRKLMLSGAGVLAFLFLMILWASGANVGKYYVKPVDGHLEIWKGRFSPQGMEKIFILENTPIPDQIQDVLSREEAFSLIFAGVINNADALLNAAQIPDFERIRDTLESARPYAVSRAASELLEKRLDKIDMMALVYKADILTAKGTVADLKSARDSLERAMSLNIDTAEKNLLKQKIAWIDQKLEQMSET